MRTLHVVVGAALTAVTLLQPASALAEVGAPRRGMTLELGIAANGVTDDDYINEDNNGIDLDPLVGIHLAGLYRFLPFLSAGLLIHYGFIFPDGDDFDAQYSDFLGVIAAVRGHYAWGRFEPWVEFGIGYAMAHTWAEGEWTWAFWTGEADGFVALHGVGFDLSLGVHIYLLDNLSVSPFFRMILAAWPTACYELDYYVSGVGGDERDDCDDPDDVYENEPDDYPHLWIVGIAAAISLAP
jgi:hypothetical protein